MLKMFFSGKVCLEEPFQTVKENWQAVFWEKYSPLASILHLHREPSRARCVLVETESLTPITILFADARADSLFHANWLVMSVGFMSDESSKGIIRILACFQMQEGMWIIWKNMRLNRNRCQIMSFFHGWRQLVFAGNTCQLSHLAFASKPLFNEVKVHGGDKQGHCQCHCWRSYRRSKWKCVGDEEISIVVVIRVASSRQG